jgi:nucleotide-binding universal stress UspA family protein
MKRFQNILVSIDVRQAAYPALDWGTQLAVANGARLTLMDVAPEFSWPVRMALPDHAHMRDLLLQEKRDLLEAIAAPLRERGLAVTTQTASGKTSLELIREALRGRHDLVVRVAKGAQSRREGFFGNTTLRLFRHCPCPVWAVRPDSQPRFGRILAAVDPAPQDEAHADLNKTIMELARSVAEREGGRLDVLHVWSLFGESALAGHLSKDEFREVEQAARAQASRAFERFLADYGMALNVENVHLIKGEPNRAIVDFVNSDGIDLLVLGTIARSGPAGLIMGNTAEMVLSRIQCAVLAVKPEGFVSSVTLPEH